MSESGFEEITRLMRAADAGDDGARESLWQRVYDELRDLAQQRARRGPAAVEPTVLVGEAWLRLAGGRELAFENRTAFFRAAASAMRNALVDEARRQGRAKRGGDRHRVTLAEGLATDRDPPTEVLALDEALSRLAEAQPRVAELVELRYFAGLRMEEAAAALGVSLATAERDWRFGRTWLRRELERGG